MHEPFFFTENMSRKLKLRDEITALVTGREKKDILILVRHDCPPGYYRTGEHAEKLITAAEAELLRQAAKITLIFEKREDEEPIEIK